MLSALLMVTAAYLVAGTVFALYFVTIGVMKLDKAARGTSIFFRLLISPGTIVLWPYLMSRLVRGSEEPREERNSHRDLARKAAK